MHKLFTKILNFRFSDFLPMNIYLAKDFEIIDQSFRQSSDSITTDREFIKQLPAIINDIADKIHVTVKFYEAVKNKNSDWLEQFEEFKHAKLLKAHSDQIFKNGFCQRTTFILKRGNLFRKI